MGLCQPAQPRAGAATAHGCRGRDADAGRCQWLPAHECHRYFPPQTGCAHALADQRAGACRGARWSRRTSITSTTPPTWTPHTAAELDLRQIPVAGDRSAGRARRHAAGIRPDTEGRMTPVFPDLAGRSVYITRWWLGHRRRADRGIPEAGRAGGFRAAVRRHRLLRRDGGQDGPPPPRDRCDITDTCRAQGHAGRGGREARADHRAGQQCCQRQAGTAAEEVTEDFWDWMQAINLKCYFFALSDGHCGECVRRVVGFGSSNRSPRSATMMGQRRLPGLHHGQWRDNGDDPQPRARIRARPHPGERADARLGAHAETARTMWARPEDLAAHMERMCLKEHLKPEDIVGGMLFLASDASRAMTGQALVIDGGVVTTG